MANRNLTAAELKTAHDLLGYIRGQLNALSGEDRELLFAYRRKVAKELGYDERGKPVERNRLKARKYGEQHSICSECGEPLEEKYSELDRKNAVDGYTPENTELIHSLCHRKRQAAKGYA